MRLARIVMCMALHGGCAFKTTPLPLSDRVEVSIGEPRPSHKPRLAERPWVKLRHLAPAPADEDAGVEDAGVELDAYVAVDVVDAGPVILGCAAGVACVYSGDGGEWSWCKEPSPLRLNPALFGCVDDLDCGWPESGWICRPGGCRERCKPDALVLHE